MNKSSQEENTQKDQNHWDEAIRDTERKLHHVETRAKRLRAAINTYRAHRDAGVPWPSGDSEDKKAGTAA